MRLSAEGTSEAPLVKRLYADAGSGLIFNFAGAITLGETTFKEGVIVLPVNSRATTIEIKPGTQLAGIRFYPAGGHGFVGPNVAEPTLLSQHHHQYANIDRLYNQLKKAQHGEGLLNGVIQWLESNLHLADEVPQNLQRVIHAIGQGDPIKDISIVANNSQRQVERQFRTWLQMTPKYYQRIVRIRQAVDYLRLHKSAKLIDVAYQFGFSDQAHMTREFKALARFTPGQVSFVKSRIIDSAYTDYR